ncbi:hypothetical protein Tco_0697672 [Tanacetum coccineum]
MDAIHHGMLNLKPGKAVSSSQPRMPSYGTQVTVQIESEKQFDKLRRKEEKKQKRGTDPGFDSDLSLTSFRSLLLASAKKSPFDDLIGHGEGSNTSAVTTLPQGTTRKHLKGYEEVSIPPTQTAPMKPGEKLHLHLEQTHIQSETLDRQHPSDIQHQCSKKTLTVQCSSPRILLKSAVMFCATATSGRVHLTDNNRSDSPKRRDILHACFSAGV